jgi:hypothetical protein
MCDPIGEELIPHLWGENTTFINQSNGFNKPHKNKKPPRLRWLTYYFRKSLPAGWPSITIENWKRQLIR